MGAAPAFAIAVGFVLGCLFAGLIERFECRGLDDTPHRLEYVVYASIVPFVLIIGRLVESGASSFVLTTLTFVVGTLFGALVSSIVRQESEENERSR